MGMSSWSAMMSTCRCTARTPIVPTTANPTQCPPTARMVELNATRCDKRAPEVRARLIQSIHGRRRFYAVPPSTIAERISIVAYKRHPVGGSRLLDRQLYQAAEG